MSPYIESYDSSVISPFLCSVDINDTNYTPAANNERQLRKLKTKTVKSEKCLRTW